jgi:hypothetical protein
MLAAKWRNIAADMGGGEGERVRGERVAGPLWVVFRKIL